MSVSAADLARYQASAARFHLTACSIVRAGESVQQDESESALACRVVPKGQYQPVGGAILLQAPLFEVHLPAQTDVVAGDTIVCPDLGGGAAYGVVQLMAPRTIEVERVCACYHLGTLSEDGAIVPEAPGVGMPERCQIRRYGTSTERDGPGGGLPSAASVVAEDVPVRIVAATMEEYPTATIPNQPQTRWTLLLEPQTDVRNNDLLLLDGGQRIYVVVRTDAPASVEPVRTAHCVLSAVSGSLGDAYVRANATVSNVRTSAYGGLSGGYEARRVHLVFSQINPAAPLERLQGGVATLSVGLIDLVDADWRQGDGLTILSMDGVSVLPAETEFTVGGVVRRPLPFCCCEADLIAPV